MQCPRDASRAVARGDKAKSLLPGGVSLRLAQQLRGIFSTWASGLLAVGRAERNGWISRYTGGARCPRAPARQTRLIVPHTLVDSGMRWPVRAYCEKNRDFVLSRLRGEPEVLDESGHDRAGDAGWAAEVAVVIEPGLRLQPLLDSRRNQPKKITPDGGLALWGSIWRNGKWKTPYRRARQPTRHGFSRYLPVQSAYHARVAAS